MSTCEDFGIQGQRIAAQVGRAFDEVIASVVTTIPPDPLAKHELIASYRGALIRVSAENGLAVRTAMADILNGLGITDGDTRPNDLQRGIFLLDIEHDLAALQALETYAYAVLAKGDRPLCDHLMEKIAEVKKRRKA